MRALWILLLLPLAACFDAEADLRFAEDEVVTADVKMTLGRQLYELVQLGATGGQSFCPKGGQTSINSESAVCEFTEERSLDKAISEVNKASAQEDFLRDAEIVRLDKERVKVIVPLDFEKVQKLPELGSDNPMLPTLLDALAGHAVVLRVHGLEIEQTNGKRLDGGKTAELIVPTAEILEPTGAIPDVFEVTVKYRSCGFSGLSC